MLLLSLFAGEWVPAGRAVGEEADVTGLKEGHKYKFRVKAVNKEGESDDLEAEEAITAKNPFGMLIFPIFS